MIGRKSRIFILVAVILVFSGGGFFQSVALAAALYSDDGSKPSAVPGYSINELEKMAEDVTKTGVGFNSIPSLNKPLYINVSNASLSMDDDEIVFIVDYPNGITRIYPQRILVWHEIVNDILPDTTPRKRGPGAVVREGDSWSISYCPLTGSVVVFKGMAGKYPSAFGVTGNLVNSNSVLFDWATQSSWSQILGVSIEGMMAGKRLERIQAVWATWRGVKIRYAGKAEVLSRSTGHSRPYGRDPYGSYVTAGNYYDNLKIGYPLSAYDNRLAPKTRILGIEHESVFGAVQVDAVVEKRALNFVMGVTPMVGLYDEEIGAVRIYDRRIGGRDDQFLTFAFFEDKFIDEDTRSVWNEVGECVYGRLRGTRLDPVYTIDCMWFAWAAFHRGSLVFPPPQPW